MEVAQGHVSDRPFARTVYTVAAKHFTGDLLLTESGRSYKVSWEDGRAVAAESAAAADSAGRIALSAGLVNSTHVSRSLEVLAKTPSSDPLDVLAGLARLGADQVVQLKRRVLIHRASRIFALVDARFTLDNARSLRADPDVPPLDARWLIYHGLRTHYTVERLDRELTPVASRAFMLADDAAGVLPAFGFADGERTVLDRLGQRGWTLQQLVDSCRELERRAVLSVVYALMATDCLEPVAAEVEEASPGAETRPGYESRGARPTTATPPVAGAAQATGSPLAQGTQRRLQFPGGGTAAAGTQPSTAPVDPERSRLTRPPPVTRPSPATMPPPATTPPPRRTATTTSAPARRAPPTTVPPDMAAAAAAETHRLIRGKVADLDRGADHFAILGVSQSASTPEVRNAYFSLAKRLHPDRLRAVGVDDQAGDAQRLFARINQAFGVLSDAQKRNDYMRVVSAGGEDAVKKSQSQAEEAALRALRAEESFRLGEMALRRSNVIEAREMFDQAVELSPEEAEYLAMSAWATWVAAPDKVAVAAAVQRRLADSLALQPDCVVAHFYSAMIAKQAGRTQAAIESFRKVLDLVPTHPEASLELRVLVSREKKDDSTRRGYGLLDKLKKR